jgi:MFS family permease
LQKRYSVFYVIGCCASACGGILAFGFMQMEGLGHGPAYLGLHYGPTKLDPTAPSGILPGISGWRWIFIMEGVLTCFLGVLGYFFLVDFPDVCAKKGGGWWFLTPAECNYVVRRINKDRDDANPVPFSLKLWASSGLDLKIWGFAMIFFCITTCTYAIAYFLPVILREGMGFSIGASQCLVAPPYFFAGICMYTTSWAADKWRMRGPVLIALAVMGLIGLPIMVRPSPALPSIISLNLTNTAQGLRQRQRRALLRRLPHHWRSQRPSPRRHGVPSEQHPGPMETGFLLRYAGGIWGHRWHLWLACVPVAGCAELSTGDVCGYYGSVADYCDLRG